ncbi:MAG: type II toxin-antitoxin system RelE/ParE family toxin [Chitinophagaceae bacterium]
MQVQIADDYLRKLFEGKTVSGKPRFNKEVIVRFKKTILKMVLADNIHDIMAQKGLNFEALSGNLNGYYSVRINAQYRLLLTLDQNEKIHLTEVITVKELTNHYK